MKTYVTPKLTCRLFIEPDIVRTSADAEFDAKDWLSGFTEGGNQ